MPDLVSWDAFGLTEENLSWQNDALCTETDPDAFYPEPGEDLRKRVADAKRVCQACPIRSECLAYALAHDERFGIWGGTTPQERRGWTKGAASGAPRPQDAEIARLTRAGLSARQIATELALTPRTVTRARARLRAEPHHGEAA